MSDQTWPSHSAERPAILSHDDLADRAEAVRSALATRDWSKLSDEDLRGLHKLIQEWERLAQSEWVRRQMEREL